MANKKPKYEKVDENTIRVIVENVSEISVAELEENRKRMLAYKEGLGRQLTNTTKQIIGETKKVDKALKDINDILENAKKLGIVAKEGKE